MKKIGLITIAFLMVFGVFTLQTGPVFANEHGGSTIQEHGGTVLKGTKDDAATLKEAAALLKPSNPELAKKLEKMSEQQCGI